MSTVFSFIVQKRLSQENENVSTEALAFILRSSPRACAGLMKLMRGVAPDLPDLQFRTQQTEGSTRPDMWGIDRANTPRLFIENKFWAGLTENQPVEYLKKLALQSNPAMLLAVVPETRVEMVWREFHRRLRETRVSLVSREGSASVHRAIVVDFGTAFSATPILAVTSWNEVLSAIEAELKDEPERRNDVHQLRALCKAADEYTPFSAADLTNQATASFVLQLNSLWSRAVELGVTEGILCKDGTREQADRERIGRYVKFPKASGVGAWFGIHFRLWRERGATPLWLYFSPSNFCRAIEVRPILEPWAERNAIDFALEDDGAFALGIEVNAGEELEQVDRSIVDRLKLAAMELQRLPAGGE